MDISMNISMDIHMDMSMDTHMEMSIKSKVSSQTVHVHEPNAAPPAPFGAGATTRVPKADDRKCSAQSR